ncbi:MAG: hypothetical protein RDV41_11775, partial [Planctomycetota bacterium]|nr:hypothetical protein [Planctomycetota bacterium]
VNRYLLESMAKIGRGAVAFVGLDEGSSEAVDLFYDRAAHAALTDIKVNWGGMTVSDVFPHEIPDLFVGRPVLLTGRFEGMNDRATVRISGRVGMEERSYAVDLDLDSHATQHEGIVSLWARWMIADLSEQEIHSPSKGLQKEMIQISTQYKVLCQYTAFVAVDSLERTAGDHGVTVQVPVPVPDGVRYDTTVKEK